MVLMFFIGRIKEAISINNAKKMLQVRINGDKHGGTSDTGIDDHNYGKHQRYGRCKYYSRGCGPGTDGTVIIPISKVTFGFAAGRRVQPDMYYWERGDPGSNKAESATVDFPFAGVAVPV